MDSDTKRSFSVLYTHQITKKRKIWQDGILRLSALGTGATLLDETGSKLDTLHVKFDQVSVGEELQSDRYLITVEGEKTSCTQASVHSTGVLQQQQQHRHQQQQHQQQQQYQQQQQPAFGCQKRMPLKRKRTGFTVPRQASKRLASEPANPTSTSVHHTTSSVVDPPERTCHKDRVGKSTLFSTPFSTAGESNNFRRNFLNVYDGETKASANLGVCVSMDGKSPSGGHPHCPSDVSGKTFQANQTPVISGVDDSFAPLCFDVDTPRMNPTCFSNVCNVETTNNLRDRFRRYNQPTENGRIGRHESEEVDQQKENIPSFSPSVEHSRTAPLKEHVTEANSKQGTNRTKYLPAPSGKRSTSQILALLGNNGKAKFKPPVKQPELQSVNPVTPKSLPNPDSDSHIANSPEVHVQPSDPCAHVRAAEFSDVMTLLGRADTKSGPASCVDPSSHVPNLGIGDGEPSLKFNKQGKTDTNPDESSAVLLQAMCPENAGNGTRYKNVMKEEIVAETDQRDETAQESDPSSITYSVKQKSLHRDQDVGFPGRVARMEQEQNHCTKDGKVWKHTDTSEDRIDEDIWGCHLRIRNEDRHNQDVSVNQADSAEDSYSITRRQNSTQDYKNCSKGGTFLESRYREGSCLRDGKQDSCHQDGGNLGSGDKGNIRRSTIQDGSKDDRDLVFRNQFTRNHSYVEDIRILKEGINGGHEKCNHTNDGKNEKIQGERPQREVGYIESYKGQLNLVPGSSESGSQDDGKQDDERKENENHDNWNYDDQKCDDWKCDGGNQEEGTFGNRNRNVENCDDINQDEDNCEDRNHDEENCDDRNHDEENCDDGNHDDEKCDDRNQDDEKCDDSNQDDENCDDRNQDEENCDDRNQDEGKCDDSNQDGENCDDKNQDKENCNDRNHDEENCDDGNQDAENCYDRNQDEEKCDDRNQDDENCNDRNQDEENCDDRNQDKGKCDDRNQDDENCDDRNQDEENCDDRNHDEENSDDRNQDEQNCDDKNQDEENCDDRNHDEENCDDGNQDDENCDDRNHDEENCDNRNQDEENCDDGNQDKEKCDDRNQDKDNRDDGNQDEENCDDRNQDEENCDDRNHDEENCDDMNQDEETCADKSLGNRNTANFAATQEETISVPKGTNKHAKDVCTLCGTELHSAQEMCEDCANQMEGGFESSWNSTSGSVELERLGHLPLQSELFSPEEKSKVSQKMPVTPLNTFEFSSPRETIKTKVKHVTAKDVAPDDLLEDWLRSVEPFTNTEKDSSDCVVPHIGNLTLRITEHEGFQKLDTSQQLSISETDAKCLKPASGNPIVGEQCVPERPENSSEFHAFQQDDDSVVSDTAGSYAISGTVLRSGRGCFEPSKTAFTSWISQEQTCCRDTAMIYRSRRVVSNPSLKTCSDVPQFLPEMWKGVARRSKHETVSQTVEIDRHEFPMMGFLQMLNTPGNQIDIGSPPMDESLRDSYPSGLEDRSREETFLSLSPSLRGTCTSSGVTSNVSRRCPDSKRRSSSEMCSACEGDCYSISPCPSFNHSLEENMIERMECQFPQSISHDSLSDCQKVQANQMLRYGRGTVSESPDMGTTWPSEVPRCYEETECLDGVCAEWNPSLQSRHPSSRCWPMFPGYSHQYAELDARRHDEQPEVLPMEEGGPECFSHDRRRCDHDWVMEEPARDPSSGALSYTQETDDCSRQSIHPAELSMPSRSHLKRHLSDDVSITSEGSFATVDKEMKRKKRDSYWYNPVSSGTVRRGGEVPTLVQAKARRELIPATMGSRQVPYGIQEEDVSQDEHLRCGSYPSQDANRWDGFRQNSAKTRPGSISEGHESSQGDWQKSSSPRLSRREQALHLCPGLSEDHMDSPVHPTLDTCSGAREYLAKESSSHQYWNSDVTLSQIPICHPFSKNASLDVNEDAVHSVEELSHPEVQRFIPTEYHVLDAPAAFRQPFHPTSDTISVPGAERNIGLPHTEATRFGIATSSTFHSLPTPDSRNVRGFQNPSVTVSGQIALSSGRSLCGDLFFPSADDVQGVASPQRQVQISASFSCVAHYKQVFTSALKEHLNIVLFELSQRYHSAKDKADVRHLDSSLQQSGDQSGASASPPCHHGNPAKMVCVKKDGANKGRFFYACSAQRSNQCKFFMWADKFQCGATNSDGKSSGSSRPSLADPTAATVYFRSHNVKLYYGCELQKRSTYSNLMPGAPAWIRKHKQQMLVNSKKKLYLKLSRKESSSSYGKEDIWVVSTDLTFEPRSTFLARSVYHGPSSSNELEIEPLCGYSTSNWTSSCTVHALLACNASSELTCLGNIQECVNMRTVPILPFLLGNRRDETESALKSGPSSFNPPAQQACTNYRSLDCSAKDIEQLATDTIEKHHLNTDQAAALRRVARMFQQASKDNTSPEPVTLIHGVFGAGKSFLLAVVILFLLRLFELSDAQHPSETPQRLPWKLLVASTTNVAVDRVLLGLLQLGFEDFIRVGSIKKIAKPVLPYSVHASDKKDSQEIRDLYEMLKTDLTPAEKHHVRRSIERQRLGRNRDHLGSVRVVGVTCAACTFPCMSSLKFPVVLLDECSQMTEPSSLLPIARFQCEKLVLVGDPKQLDPTLQGSEAARHRRGLEQTLFNRLILLGSEPILLRTQYRCHPTISAIANCLFYDRQLVDGVSAQQRPPLAPLPTLCFYSVSSGQECYASDGSFYNDQEASFVVSLIETLVLLGVEPAEIGVITLYKAQTVKINVLLQASKLSAQNNLKAIQISTVDAFQGGEKGVIILSCVRTDYMGFADSDKRTNVALTRSKNHLLIVGNLRILSANALWGKVIDQCKGAENGIQFSQAFIKHWTPRLEELVNQDRANVQTGCKAVPPDETRPDLSPASQAVESSAEEVQLPSPRHSSPSYSPLSAMDESKGDTSFSADEHLPCFDIGDLQDILD